ncbi:pyridoxal-dependent decarboxylase [Xylariaceae sp. FL0804]|nr:pyridoxal-dependent decarboxylase [Xylariaceae sp. FL0804]
MDAEAFLQQAYERTRRAARAPPDAPAPTLPTPDRVSAARAALRDSVAAFSASGSGGEPGGGRGRGWGWGPEATLDHVLDAIVPALNGQNRSGRYWGFVTGGTLPVAEAADNVVSALDQNVQVHLPDQTIATEVEDAALRMLIRLLRLGNVQYWEGRTFTTGATASNVLGLACGREAVLRARLPPTAGEDSDPDSVSVGELGLLRACAKAGVDEIQVLTSMGHSSLAKAASVVGLGRSSVRVLPLSDAEPWRLDIDAVERELRRERVASIIAVSAGEVNTGRFALAGHGDMLRLRGLADRYGAWIHVDGAFGIFARCLPPTPEFRRLRDLTMGLELADSIGMDGHKLLNVPYDNGIFLTRHAASLTSVFRNPNAAYLTASAGSAAAPAPDDTIQIQSPLNVGLENSRRFRALPTYAALASEGRAGYADMMARMVRLARRIARVVRELSDDYELLPTAMPTTTAKKKGNTTDEGGGSKKEEEKQGEEEEGEGEEDENDDLTHIVVLFRARDDALNAGLARAINDTREWYVGATSWEGRPACRVAVASWRADVDADAALVRRSLAEIAERHLRGKGNGTGDGRRGGKGVGAGLGK